MLPRPLQLGPVRLQSYFAPASLNVSGHLQVGTTNSDGLSPFKTLTCAFADTLHNSTPGSIDQNHGHSARCLKAIGKGVIPPRRRCLGDKSLKHSDPECHRANAIATILAMCITRVVSPRQLASAGASVAYPRYLYSCQMN
jgi:hypothetical protein